MSRYNQQRVNVQVHPSKCYCPWYTYPRISVEYKRLTRRPFSIDTAQVCYRLGTPTHMLLYQSVMLTTGTITQSLRPSVPPPLPPPLHPHHAPSFASGSTVLPPICAWFPHNISIWGLFCGVYGRSPVPRRFRIEADTLINSVSCGEVHVLACVQTLLHCSLFWIVGCRTHYLSSFWKACTHCTISNNMCSENWILSR